MRGVRIQWDQILRVELQWTRSGLSDTGWSEFHSRFHDRWSHTWGRGGPIQQVRKTRPFTRIEIFSFIDATRLNGPVKRDQIDRRINPDAFSGK